MSPVRRRSNGSTRRGFTLVELLFSLSLFVLVVSLVWRLAVAARRQGEHVEEVSDMMRAVMLLQSSLAADLESAVDLAVLGAHERPESRSAEVMIPVFAGYRGGDDAPLRFRPLLYRFDDEARTLYRDGRPLLVGLVDRVHFRWRGRRSPDLEVTLEGRAGATEQGRTMRIRLPAALGATGGKHWRHARHHRRLVRLE